MTFFGFRNKILSSFLFVFFIWGLGCEWFSEQIPHIKNNIPENSADAIIVLTGDTGRIEYGLELLAGNAAKILFISGAGEKVTVKDILHKAKVNIREGINESAIVLGHQAENTIGNAEEIKKWLQNTTYKKIILVTSNYHIPRSLLELSTTLPNISITTAPVIANDNELLLSEYHKYIASKLRHLFVSVTQKK